MSRMTKSSLVWIITATVLSLFVSMLGIVGIRVLGFQSGDMVTNLLIGLPVLSFPFYLSVFRSPKLAALLIWVLFIANAFLLWMKNPHHMFAAIALSRMSVLLFAIVMLTHVAIGVGKRRAVNRL